VEVPNVTARHSISPLKRLVIWEAHGGRCFHCHRPLALRKLTIDHLFPRILLSSPSRLARIQREYSLGEDFRVHDYMNWVPAHAACNHRKSHFIPRYSKTFAADIDRAWERSHVAWKMHRRLVRWASRDATLLNVLDGLRYSSITAPQLRALIRKFMILYFGFRRSSHDTGLQRPGDASGEFVAAVECANAVDFGGESDG